MLSHRITTAALLIPLTLAVTILLPSSVFAIVLGAVACGCAYEWAALAGFSAVEERRVYAGLVLAIMCLFALFAPPWLPARFGLVFFAVVVLWWCMIIHRLVEYQNGLEWSAGPRFVLGAGILVIVSAWYAMVSIHALPRSGYLNIILLMLLVWASDIGAYFAGKKFGRKKLAERISPGKTWVGVWGGAGAGLVVMLFVGPLFGLSAIGAFALLLPTLLFAVVGDLFESLVKRQAGVKDSGSLLPGHGGLLDRVDSMLAAAPAFAIIAHILGAAT